uniref:Uncharacterized protein n=1 Tax=Arundo donax TaxID=35708 RepID=A0A0A9GFM6_ARUDO
MTTHADTTQPIKHTSNHPLITLRVQGHENREKNSSTAPLCIKFIILALFSNQAQKKTLSSTSFHIVLGMAFLISEK